MHVLMHLFRLHTDEWINAANKLLDHEKKIAGKKFDEDDRQMRLEDLELELDDFEDPLKPDVAVSKYVKVENAPEI